ncbi:hypothetical protein Btru_035325 [Bulinus truncatus]|nr:hypothetical protein Btru_035325 [Bulinus truncatus]
MDTFAHDFATYKLYLRLQRAQTQLLPAICVLGFVANSLSLVVFLQPTLRRLSCSFYLAAKSVADLIFLATVFIIWLVRVDIHVFNTSGVCQIVVFFSYLTAFVSIWLAVALTVENLLCVWKPWFVQRTCSAASACALTLVISVLGIGVYQFSLWNNGVGYKSSSDQPTMTLSGIQPLMGVDPGDNSTSASYDHISGAPAAQVLRADPSEPLTSPAPDSDNNGSTFASPQERACMQLEEFKHLIIMTTYVDTIITIFIPIIILAVTNCAIAVIAVRSARRSRTLRKEKAVYQLPGEQGPPGASKRTSTSASLEKQASKFLFLVSVTLLVFHAPVHIVRLKMILINQTYLDIFLQRIFETLYYTHYAISFFVYLVYGSNFRRVFVAIVTRKSY